MLENHAYEKIILFLTGVGIGIYLFQLRGLYRVNHPPVVRRRAKRATLLRSIARMLGFAGR